MEYQVLRGLIERLDLKPSEGSKLAIFLTRINNESYLTGGSWLRGKRETNDHRVHFTDHE